MESNNILVKEMCIAGRDKLIAGEIITPGCLVARNCNNYLVPHSNIAGAAQKMIALEQPEPGNDNNYKVGAYVDYKICRPGDQVNAYLENGGTVVIGDNLCSAGNGTFMKAVVIEQVALAIALEAVVAIGDTKILVEML